MDFFISYKSEDREQVIKIKELIERETSAFCWMDIEGIENAEYFVNVIQKAIDESDKMILMVSENTCKSNWIMKETFYAENRAKSITPIVIDGKGLQGWLALFFSNIQYIDYLDEKKWRKYVSKLKQIYPPRNEQETMDAAIIDILQTGWKYFVKREYDIAADFFRRVALQGHADAQYRMGMCYLSNRGVNQNYKEAAHWFKEAASQQHIEAMFKLGICYSRGTGVIKSKREAFQWFMKAASLGHVLSMFNVGQCYEYGNGIKKNICQAREWYIKAANKDNEDAIVKLASLL